MVLAAYTIWAQAARSFGQALSGISAMRCGRQVLGVADCVWTTAVKADRFVVAYSLKVNRLLAKVP